MKFTVLDAAVLLELAHTNRHGQTGGVRPRPGEKSAFNRLLRAGLLMRSGPSYNINTKGLAVADSLVHKLASAVSLLKACETL